MIFNLHLNSFIILMLLFDLLLEGLLNLSEVVALIQIILIVYTNYYVVRAVMIFYQIKWWVGLYTYIVFLFEYFILILLLIGTVFVSTTIMI